MRLYAVVPMLAACAYAQQPGREPADLIPDDAAFVCGADVAAYQRSELAEVFPLTMIGGVADALQHVRKVMFITGSAEKGRGYLMIIKGSSLAFASLLERDYPGIAREDGFAVFDAGTAALGDPQMIRAAVQRWAAGKRGELAAKARELGEAYDGWFIAVRPFENMERAAASEQAKALKHRADFVGMLEEVRGGVRIGALTEVRVEARTRTWEDALALAALSRWLPGFIQTVNPEGQESAMAEVADNFRLMPAGNSVSLTFTLNEARLRELAASWRAKLQMEPE